MNAKKCKALRAQARALTIGQPERVYRTPRRRIPTALQTGYTTPTTLQTGCTRQVYQTLKHA